MTPKFHHAGLDWIPHTPGDPMPCPGDTLVRVFLRSDLACPLEMTFYETAAFVWDWSACSDPRAEIIGWYPVEEQPSLARRVLDLLEAGDIEQAKHELRKELE